MLSGQEKSVSPAEWQIMRVVWAQKETSSRYIIDCLAEAMAWKDSTIKTLIRRLVDKGWLDKQKQGRSYIYRAQVSQEEANRLELKTIFDNLCQCQAGELIVQCIEDTPLSQDMIDHIQEALDEKAPQAVTCSCLPGQCQCQVKH